MYSRKSRVFGNVIHKKKHSYDIVVPQDIYQLGLLRQNGSWTGALGLLKRNVSGMFSKSRMIIKTHICTNRWQI